MILHNFNLYYWLNINLLFNELLLILLVFINIVLITSAFFGVKSSNLSNRLQIIPTILDVNILGLLLCIILLIFKLITIRINICDVLIFKTLGGIHHFSYINNILYISNYTQYIKILLLITGITVMISTQLFLKYKKEMTLEYPLLLQMGIFFLTLTISTYSFISFFLSIFGISIILYIVLAINKNVHSSREAAIKYFLLSAISSGLFCYSIFFFLLIYKTTFFYTINVISTIIITKSWNAYQYDYSLFANLYAITIFWMACCYKLGSYPSHLWTIEIYHGSANPVMAFFVMPVKLVIFSAISKILIDVLDSLQWVWSVWVWVSALFSLVWGCFGALLEQDFKKFLAFSSINQIGFLLFGISCISFEAFRSSIIYLTIYMITNIILFQIFLSVTKNLTNSRLIYIQEFNSVMKTNFILGIFLTISMFSMAGIPPLAGFFGKFFLFLHAFEMNYFLILVTAMFTSLISAFYYLNIVNNIWFLKNIQLYRYTSEINSLGYFLIIVSTIFITLYMFLNPRWFLL